MKMPERKPENSNFPSSTLTYAQSRGSSGVTIGGEGEHNCGR